jgi:predicted oxidoreductase
MNWEFGIKSQYKEMENMINVCLENKITTFDHADIYGITPPRRLWKSIFFQQNC